MRREKISPLILGVVIFIGIFSIIPNSFGGDATDELCFDETQEEIPCDDDGDGIPNEEDNCPDVANPGQEDIDGNGIGDACQDVDGDEIIDLEDNCPDVANPGQEDIDGNGIGDACQDVDGDTILDLEDNCPFIPNPEQEDSNENGIGDICEDQIELLVDATFPPGDTIIVELPEDPDTGIFTISLELPETEGGDVLIETTDAGDTPGNFSFLGFIIDFNAPCTDVCVISFTFTQASLDAQGITLDQVTVFHDINENGSFEDDEAVPTVITGSDPFTATANASFTSKFSVGGIKALALGALAGSGGGSRGGSPPTLENLSFDGVRTINEDGTIGFGGFIIDEISSVNDFPTQTFETGVPFELRFPFSEDNGADAIDHVAVYVLHEGDETTYDSDLYLIYDRYEPLETFDSNGYISNFTVNIVEKSSVQVDMIFGITFALPMEPSDIIVRAWDYHRRTIDYKFNQLIQVVESDSNNELIANTDLTSWNSPTNDNSIIDSSTILKYDFQSKSTNNDSGDVSEYNTLAIPLWIKFNANWWSQEEIGDDDFVAGIKYLIERDIITIPELVQVHHEGVKEIPSWIKYNAEWWAGDLVSDEEFVRTIQWLIKEGVMKV